MMNDQQIKKVNDLRPPTRNPASRLPKVASSANENSINENPKSGKLSGFSNKVVAEIKTVKFKYIISISGIVKTLLILAQIANWWSIAVSAVSVNGQIVMSVSSVAIRDATLFFSLSGLVHSIALYSLNLFNVYNISEFSFYEFSSLLIVRIVFFLRNAFYFIELDSYEF
jgi:hypothetical protein